MDNSFFAFANQMLSLAELQARNILLSIKKPTLFSAGFLEFFIDQVNPALALAHYHYQMGRMPNVPLSGIYAQP
jgi:hypothetical protein